MATTIPLRVATEPAAAPDVSHYLRPGTLRLPALPPLSLYIHFPWCVRKCPYCDFNSHEPAGGLSAIPEAMYLDALRADLEASLPLIWGRRIQSIFIGGGTPSLMSAPGLDRLLSDARALLPLEADCEITMEANPGSFEAGRFAAYRRAGVNRLSIGIQSFDDAHLAALGRVHDRAQALAAVETAQRLFDTFNLDLMYALPSQTLAQAQADVEQALALSAPHLSLYQLTLEPNTVFAKYPPALPDEDTAAAMHEWIEDRMAAAGFAHYEVSAYARAGHACRHNLNYWQFGDYLGIGAGAHGKLSFPHRVLRQTRLRQPASYLEGAARGVFAAERVEVARADLPFEFMLNALRLNDGFAPALFTDRTGLPLSSIEPGLAQAEARGLLTRDLDRIVPTALGRRFLSDLQALFLR
ncbi:MAG: radical SAM family heme chaperone HemW [Burkholderiaceae bacterium]|jgi:oxygen-independent coproporphyrinogen-3 oxidase|nr:radical SAM family heme chaperone HemW [Burkholderiaceae bacterium]